MPAAPIADRNANRLDCGLVLTQENDALLTGPDGIADLVHLHRKGFDDELVFQGVSGRHETMLIRHCAAGISGVGAAAT